MNWQQALAATVSLRHQLDSKVTAIHLAKIRRKNFSNDLIIPLALSLMYQIWAQQDIWNKRPLDARRQEEQYQLVGFCNIAQSAVTRLKLA